MGSRVVHRYRGYGSSGEDLSSTSPERRFEERSLGHQIHREYSLSNVPRPTPVVARHLCAAVIGLEPTCRAFVSRPTSPRFSLERNPLKGHPISETHSASSQEAKVATTRKCSKRQHSSSPGLFPSECSVLRQGMRVRPHRSASLRVPDY
jgi:hypothetical protein